MCVLLGVLAYTSNTHTDRRDGGDYLAQLQSVQYCRLASPIQANHQYTNVALLEPGGGEEERQDKAHSIVCLFGTQKYDLIFLFILHFILAHLYIVFEFQVEGLPGPQHFGL